MLPPGFGWEYTPKQPQAKKGTLSFSVTPNMAEHEALMEIPNVNHMSQQPEQYEASTIEINGKLHLTRKTLASFLCQTEKNTKIFSICKTKQQKRQQQNCPVVNGPG